MPGERDGIRVRWAIYSGSAVGGLYWALLSTLVIHHGRHTPVFTVANLVLVIAVNVLTALGGLLLVLMASTTEGRTLGVALIVCALSGWVVFGSIVIPLALLGQ